MRWAVANGPKIDPSLPQAERIRLAALHSYEQRDRYTEQQVSEMLAILSSAEADIKKALVRYDQIGALKPGEAINQASLKKWEESLAEITKQLKADSTLLVQKFTKGAFKTGIHQGIADLGRALMPGYADLGPDGVLKTASAAFTVMDTHALDFLVNFNVQLAGDVTRELGDNVRRIVALGIAQGKSLREVVREIGGVVKDRDAFLKAGIGAFKTAQQRMQTIARTETLRAHNQGRIKFYDHIGVQQLEWLALGDERQCKICGALNGKVFPANKFPTIPAHPLCRCTQIVAEPLVVCDAGLGASAAPGQAACLLSPKQIQDQASAKHGEAVILGQKAAQGKFDELSLAQLQDLSKKEGLPIYMSKADYLAKLAKLEPGVDFASLSSKALEAKIKQHKIGKVKTKDDLIAQLKKAKAFQQQVVQELAKKAANPPEPPVVLPDFGAMSKKQLEDEAAKAGISLFPTKADYIQWLDELEPGVNHAGLSGAALAAKKAQYGLGKVKTKEQLAKELAAHYKPGAALKAKQEKALKEVEEQKQKLADLLAQTKLFSQPTEVVTFHEQMAKVQEALAKAKTVLNDVDLAAFAKQAAAKQAEHAAKVAAIGSKDMKKFAQEAGVKWYQWASGPEVKAILEGGDPAKVLAAKLAVFEKYKAYALKHGSAKLKAELPAIEAALKAGQPGPAAPKSSTIPPEPPPAPVTLPKVTPQPPPAPPPPPPAPEPAAKLKPKAAPKKAAPAPPAPPVTAPKPASTFADKDEAWAKNPPKLTFLKTAKDLGGAHTKHLFTDEQGKQWLFKPVSEDFRAHGDEVGYRVGRLIDPNAIEVRVVELNVPGKGKQLGSVQPMVPNLASPKDFSGVHPASLKATEVAQLQREQVIDWLIGNHDSHSENFLRTKDEKVLGIDKGQLFKFLGKDKLDTSYHPNKVHGAGEPVYHALNRAVRDGQIKGFDPRHTLEAIKRVELVSDDEYRELLRPYAERRFTGNAAGLQGFYQGALARKNGLRKDFEKLYADVLKQPKFSFADFETAQSIVAAEEAKASGKLSKLGPTEVRFIEEAKAAGWQGKVIPLDSNQVEDQNMLTWVEKMPDGTDRSVLSFKVRPEVDKALLKVLNKNLVEDVAVKVVQKIGEPLKEDIDSEFYKAILGGAKTLGKHSGNKGGYNQSTLQQMKEAMEKLKDLVNHTDPDVAEMAKHYIETGEKVLKGVQEHKKLGYNFSQYLRKSVPPTVAPAKKSAAEYQVTKGPVRLDRKQVKQGRIHVVQSGVSNSAAFGSGGLEDGIQYNVTFPDGMEVQYRPWAGKNHYAQRGQVEVRFAGALDPLQVERAMERLEKLGIQAHIASPVDAELMYLQKQAYILKKHTSSDYEGLVNGLNGKGASKEEWVATLRQYWSKELGVKDVTALSGYNPQGEWQQGFVTPGTKVGYRHQMRFDISEEKLRKEMDGHLLYHSLTNGNNMPDFIDLVMGSNGAMVSTVEKLRIGVPVGGMSPKQDMDTGGATYFFTRIAPKNQKHSGLYFKVDLLRRMDAVTYDHDKYGKVTGDEPTTHRKPTIPEWKQVAGKSGNETIFKYSVTLLDNIDHIQANSSAERDKIIAAFKKHGVTKLPDGRSIDQVVRTP